MANALIFHVTDRDARKRNFFTFRFFARCEGRIKILSLVNNLPSLKKTEIRHNLTVKNQKSEPVFPPRAITVFPG